MAPLDKDEWLRYFSERIKVEPRFIEKAFADELAGKLPDDAPLEIPDQMEITFKYSYGGVSRFFRFLRDQGKLLGAKCRRCSRVYLPPRIHCARCYSDTDWVEVGPEGTVVTFTVVHFASTKFYHKTPFIGGLIRFDGADTLMVQNVFMDDVSQAHTGMRVRAVFAEHRHGNMGDFFCVPVPTPPA